MIAGNVICSIGSQLKIGDNHDIRIYQAENQSRKTQPPVEKDYQTVEEVRNSGRLCGSTGVVLRRIRLPRVCRSDTVSM